MLYAYINNYFIIFLLKSLHNRYFFVTLHLISFIVSN